MPLHRGLRALETDIAHSAVEADALRDRLLKLEGQGPKPVDISGEIEDLNARAHVLEERSRSMAAAATSIVAQCAALDIEAAELRSLAEALRRATMPVDAVYAPAGALEGEAAAAGDIAADLRSYAALAGSLRDLLPRRAPYSPPEPTLWSKAPSGLPFWFGGFKDLDALSRLVAGTPVGNGGALDIVMDYDVPSPTPATTVANTIAQWSNGSSAYRFLTSGRSKAFVWTAHPFSGGANHRHAADWPTPGEPVPNSFGMCPNRPPTFSGDETGPQRRDKQLKVWGYGADGWMDDIWRRRFVAMKQGYFNKYGLHEIVLVLRAAHELDLQQSWGAVTSPRCNSIAALTQPSDMEVVKEALRRFNDLFLTVFGQEQEDIVGDVAYPVDNLWTYHNPVSEHFMPVDSLLACPDNAYLVGPDIYDRWPPSFTEAAFLNQAKIDRTPTTTSYKGRRGLIAWLDWCKANGRLLAIGEFGVWSETFAADGVSRPAHEGWDNAAWISIMMQWLKNNAQHIAFALYFNADPFKRAGMPGHRIDTWPGIDDPAIPCERTPLGDVNRCASRALRDWMKAQTPL